MDKAMNIAKEFMLDEIRFLSPEEKIELLLTVAEKLIPTLRNVVGETEILSEIYKSYKNVILVGRRWLNGEIKDPHKVIEPLENPSVRPFDSLEFEYKDTEHFGNLRLVGNMIAEAIFYAGQIQFERVGDSNVPQTLEEPFTDEEIIGELQRTLSRASPALKEKFKEIWKIQFQG